MVPVVGLDGREYSPARDAGIQPGDIIVSIDGQDIHRPEQVSYLVNAAAEHKAELTVVIRRNQRIMTRKVRPVRSQRIDLYGQGRCTLRNLAGGSRGGVGTLSFYDPQTGRYRALGHPIEMFPVGRCALMGQYCGGIHRQHTARLSGSPGEKLGFFHGEQDLLGTIDYNSRFGIFGTWRLPENPFPGTHSGGIQSSSEEGSAERSIR